MKKKILLIIAILAILVVTAFAIWIIFPPKNQAGLKIQTTPVADVYLNEKRLGKTPYEGNGLKSGEYTLKLATANGSWETRTRLSPGVYTVVNRTFGITEASSSGEMLWFDIGEGISVVSWPESASILVDGKEVGVTPASVRDVPTGAHKLTIAKLGLIPKTFTINIVPDYKLVAQVWLLPELSTAPAPLPQAASPSAKPQKTIIVNSPTGWLRVRKGPGLANAEVGKVNNNEKYSVQDEQNDWLKIKLSNGQEGWVSAQFVKQE